jgi:Uma2 family endonuclease
LEVIAVDDYSWADRLGSKQRLGGRSMTQVKVKFTTFEDYLSYSDQTPMEGRYELIDGELIELPPESESNIWVADNLQFLLAIAQVVSRRLIKTHACEIQVPVLQPKDSANRYPDLVVLRPEHLDRMKQRLKRCWC